MANVLSHGCIDDVTVKTKGEGTGEAPERMPIMQQSFMLLSVSVLNVLYF